MKNHFMITLVQQVKMTNNNYPVELEDFIEKSSWIFAKTYADTWAHWYIVQEQVDNELFMELANYIDENGYKEFFYLKQMTFFDYGEHTYWHMENIINRCLLADTYHRRVVDGRLPKE